MIRGGAIVVGVDDALETRDAAALGRVLARAAEVELRLVSAVHDPLADVVAVQLRLDVDRIHESLLARARNAVARNLSGIFDPLELARVLELRIGRPEYVLVEAGREFGADLVVLGGTHRGSVESWVRRGTAHHLLRRGERSVMVTGPGAPVIERVLVAVDVSFAAPHVIEAARHLARLLDVRLEAVHVAGHAQLPAGWDPAVNLEAVYEEVERRVEDEIWPLLPQGVPRRVLRGTPVPNLREAAGEVAGTLLVLGAQGRGRVDRLLLGSTTEALLHDPPSTLAIIPVPAPQE